MTSFRALLFALGSLVLVYTIMVVANEGVNLFATTLPCARRYWLAGSVPLRFCDLSPSVRPMGRMASSVFLQGYSARHPSIFAWNYILERIPASRHQKGEWRHQQNAGKAA